MSSGAKTKVLNILLYIVFAIGLLGAGDLVMDEIRQSNICPKILGIPACYIILACFIVPFIVHLWGKFHKVYFALTGFAWIIAIIASFMQATGLGECPKTASGTPMCYYSFALFTALITLKILLMRLHKN